MFWNALAIVYGAFVALFPKRAIDYLTRLLLSCYENPEDLEPSEWYISIARAEGVLLVLAGVLAVVLELLSARSKNGSSSDSDEAESS